ncbi:hypothetical protein GOODEAATRI_020336, partial [Goodea atripinnis]
PTFKSICDESIGLFTFCYSSARAAVSLNAGAKDGPRPSTVWVHRGVGWGQEAGRVWICCSRMVNGAIPSEAVGLWLARGSVSSSLLCCHLIPRPPRPGTAVGRR